MTEEKESLAWKLFLQESEKRVSAIEAQAEAINREAERRLAEAKRKKLLGLLTFWKSKSV